MKKGKYTFTCARQFLFTVCLFLSLCKIIIILHKLVHSQGCLLVCSAFSLQTVWRFTWRKKKLFLWWKNEKATFEVWVYSLIFIFLFSDFSLFCDKKQVFFGFLQFISSFVFFAASSFPVIPFSIILFDSSGLFHGCVLPVAQIM